MSDTQVESKRNGAVVEEPTETMGRRLASLRALRGLGQAEAGAELGISQPHVSALELDQARPSIPLLIKLSEFYRTTIDYLVKGKAA